MKDKIQLFNSLLNRIKQIVESPSNKSEKLTTICKLLKDDVHYYNWVGFYLVDKSRDEELMLGPFAGEPTEHIKIPFGSGVCGRAAERKETFVVQDVSKETNYLSCSPKVKSEIVVPILKNAEVVGELDIDSHLLSPFTEEDKDFLEKVCRNASELF